MPISPQRFRFGLSATLRIAFMAVTLLAPLGCELLHLDQHAEVMPTAPPWEGRDIIARGASPAPPPGKFVLRRGYYVIYYDFDLDKDDPLFADLDSLPEQVFGELKLPPANRVVQVFLFDTQDRYERYMKLHYKDLPPRRAYFLQAPGSKDDLKIYTYIGKHLSTDLRHEFTHALLHSALKDVPLWLDEGLAGYFELPPGNDGVNPEHLEVLRRGPFQPDLPRLEKLEEVQQMGRPEYREAWAWVHYMLRGDLAAKKVLQDYLQALRTNTNPGPLQPHLREAVLDPETYLIDHLEKMEWPRPKVAASKPY